jgi:hypothetical protein
MTKILTFVDSANTVYAYPVDRLFGIRTTDGTSMIMNFKNMTGGTADLDADEVDITFTDGKEVEVLAAICDAINGHAGKSGNILIADDVNSKYIHADITGIAVTVQA